jgi:enamine deaminase RidA (YjgF/YER057c/UK114 family)
MLLLPSRLRFRSTGSRYSENKFFVMKRVVFKTAASLVVFSAVALAGFGHKKKEQEPKPQVLPLPKELPRALPVDTKNIAFRITPLLKPGRLSAQIRETLSDLIKDTRGETIVKIRAFVAGAGDTRRVQEMVSDLFTEKKLPLPVLTIIQVGGLGQESGVVMEAVVDGRKAVNPNGLVFIGGQPGDSLASSVQNVRARLAVAGVSSADVLRTTCFTGRLVDYAAMTSTLSAAFPNAALNIVQALRDPVDARATCESVARIPEGSSPNPAALPAGAHVSFVTSPQLVFTGLQLSFGTYLADADSALSRLSRDVEPLHAEIRNAVSVNAFSLNPAATSALQKTMSKFNLAPQTLTIQPVEGLPSLDAALGMEAILQPGTSITELRQPKR